MKLISGIFLLFLIFSNIFAVEIELGLHENEEEQEGAVGISIEDLELHANEEEIDPNTSFPDLEERLERLTKWTNDRGVDTSKVFINAKAPLRGMYARTDIKKGEDILFFEKGSPLLINDDVIFAEGSPVKDLAPFNETLAHFIWGLWHLYEIDLGDKSAYKPYLDILPKNFTMPNIQCSAEVFNEIGKIDYNLLGFAQSQRKHFDYYYAQFKNKFFPDNKWAFPNYDTKEFEERFWWAYNMIRSRTWHKLQVPFADMFNHQPFTILPDSSNGNFVFRANKDFKKGEEVFISYGPKNDWNLWTTYGFVLLENNAANCYSFSFDTSKAAAFFQSMKQSIKNTVQIQFNKHYQAYVSQQTTQTLASSIATNELEGICVRPEAKQVDKLIHIMRMHQLSSKDLALYDQTVYKGLPVSLETETRILSSIHSHLMSEGRVMLNISEELTEKLSHFKGNYCYDTYLRILKQKEITIRRLIAIVRNKWNKVLSTGVLQSSIVLDESASEIPIAHYSRPTQVYTIRRVTEQQQQQQQQQQQKSPPPSS